MSEAALASGFDSRIEPGRAFSVVLAALVHLVLFAVLLFGVRWQNRPPEAFEVELWREPPPPPAPVVEPPKPPPVIEPEPPKPEPVIEKPDIAVKEPPPPKPEVKPKPKPRPEPVAKPKPKPEPRPVVDTAAKAREQEARRLREELQREQLALATDRERQALKDQLARDAAAVRNKGLEAWKDKVRAKIRSNVVLPQAIKGNPQSVFEVVQLPTGEVISVQLRKSSGIQALDDAVERAIWKSSPLPKPDRLNDFMRSFELKYWPHD